MDPRALLAALAALGIDPMYRPTRHPGSKHHTNRDKAKAARLRAKASRKRNRAR